MPAYVSHGFFSELTDRFKDPGFFTQAQDKFGPIPGLAFHGNSISTAIEDFKPFMDIQNANPVPPAPADTFRGGSTGTCQPSVQGIKFLRIYAPASVPYPDEDILDIGTDGDADVFILCTRIKGMLHSIFNNRLKNEFGTGPY
jgi:hypothetical protein